MLVGVTCCIRSGIPGNDMPFEVEEFYEMFYHYQLTDQEISELLEGAKN